ncbi:hypothetical protein INR49_013365 [Caranx melampygus]|nr:hypothetical protein INR49_013365 [Caranx melampygus]
MGSPGDSEKMIQRLNDELQEAQEQANTEKHKCMELQGILEEERKENKQQADESAKQIKLLQGQLRQLQDEMVILREQIDVSSGSRDELQSARDEVKSLKRALESATAERDRDVAAIQTNLATVSKDLDKWRQTASKYEHEIDNLQRDLQQQSKQWQKTAEIQANELQSMQVECNGLQKECSVLRSEKQDIVNKHQKEKSGLQSECASLRAEREELLKTNQKDKSNLQSECAILRSEKEAVLQRQQQLEKDLSSSRAQNAELSNSLKSLERSQQELEKRLASLQLQHQQDSTKLQTQLEEADSRSNALQREYEEAKMELSDLKEKYEKTEQEKQSLTDELEGCKANMKELQEKGTKWQTPSVKALATLGWAVSCGDAHVSISVSPLVSETLDDLGTCGCCGSNSCEAAMAAELDVVNLFIIAGGTLAIPILAFVASFLLWPSALIKVYYWYWRRTLGLQVRYADCGGYRFCYSYRGKPGMRPSILMLHGFSAHKDTWLTVVKYLPKHLHLVCVDMPGHEGTTRTNTEDYSIQGQVGRIHQETFPSGGNRHGRKCIRHPCETKFDNHLQDLEHSNYTLNIPLIPTTPEEMEDMFRLCSHVRFKIPQQILQGLVDVREPHNNFYQEVFMEIVSEKSICLTGSLTSDYYTSTSNMGQTRPVLLQPGAEHSCPVRLAANINDSLTAPWKTNPRPLLEDTTSRVGKEHDRSDLPLKYSALPVGINLQMDNGDWGHRMTTPVTLNVGGHLYTTSLSTLQRYPDSMLGAMFRGDFPTTRDSQGNYFIDRDGTLFRYILNFLRTSELTLPVDFTETDLLRKEADFYQIEPLIQCLNDPKPLYPPDIFEQVVELSSTRKLSKYSNPVAVIITQLTITTKVHALLEGISNNFTKWNKHMMDTRDCQVSFTFGPSPMFQRSKNVKYFLSLVPGRRRLGTYRFLPIFFCIGGIMEWIMINVRIGKETFYDVYRRKQSEREYQQKIADGLIVLNEPAAK